MFLMVTVMSEPQLTPSGGWYVAKHTHTHTQAPLSKELNK